MSKSVSRCPALGRYFVKRSLALCFGLVLALSLLSGCGTSAKLSKNELADFEEALNTESNYGFLLSNYDGPSDVDLSQLFYVGAGLDRPDNASGIIEAYEATLKDGAPDCGCTILTTEQIDEFLLSKTGCSLEDMTKSLGWDYVEPYDAYIFYHGDTNIVRITCTDGSRIEKDLYEVHYEIPGGILDDKGNVFERGTVTVKTMDDALMFVSNSWR